MGTADINFICCIHPFYRQYVLEAQKQSEDDNKDNQDMKTSNTKLDETAEAEQPGTEEETKESTPSGSF